ncbi:MAG: ABC transporter ATP-binding protein [bacterium]
MINFDGVTKDFGSFCAVDQLDVTVPRGELYGFLGPNGAGKTTTVKMSVGLLRPTSGCVEINGNNVVEHPEKSKQITGYIPDTPYVYPQLTMEEYLDFVEDIYRLSPGESRPIREHYFEEFRLGEWHQDLIKNLSHGMKQKMLFTGIFMMEPQVMVIDEPMVGLDPESARVLKEALRYEVEERGTAIFLSTHSLEVAEEICDRVGILREGELIAEGEFEELQEKADETLEQVFIRITGEDTAGGNVTVQ